MSEAPDLSESEAFAAEHALGVLNARERGDAEARMAREPAFAAEVEAWRERLAPMYAEVAAVSPTHELWRRIERSLPANDNAATTGRVRFWRNSAMGGFGLAAASLAAIAVILAQPPRIVTEVREVRPQGELISASLTATSGRAVPLFVAAYDPDRQAVIVTSLLPEGSNPQKVQELWLIAGKENPKPLGFLEPGRSKIIPVQTDMAGKIAAGAALAVSIEEPGGSKDPNGPQGPVVGVGELAKPV
ncbi:anti-sigma factor [uncultured Phenylobacterium sp.]|uniref:anti-sigma factor n=1 Tax=uncultured Phenylobacterium sp. TaxID=349273 RepID=UPI0025E3B948|nr:anti-sigma factor [uncultured Phenylobacterium sp.]